MSNLTLDNVRVDSPPDTPARYFFALGPGCCEATSEQYQAIVTEYQRRMLGGFRTGSGGQCLRTYTPRPPEPYAVRQDTRTC